MRLITANLNNYKKKHSSQLLIVIWHFSLGNLELLFKGTKVIYFEDFEEI